MMDSCRWLVGVFKVGEYFIVQYGDGSLSRLLTPGQAWRIVGAAILSIPAVTRGARWGAFVLN